ncbi:hypothetical protein EIP91_002969 [Steccherinum ochraceum]|uniref:Uncharacterized protein n=1 Tax=Steccherinum ochraceum TaxID=92696 RepID=A0A4R0RCX3_9APHY|nr:hypothetical protein EIP91_002969 [Steccherinum ochraceum]
MRVPTTLVLAVAVAASPSSLASPVLTCDANGLLSPLPLTPFPLSPSVLSPALVSPAVPTTPRNSDKSIDIADFGIICIGDSLDQAGAFSRNITASPVQELSTSPVPVPMFVATPTLESTSLAGQLRKIANQLEETTRQQYVGQLKRDSGLLELELETVPQVSATVKNESHPMTRPRSKSLRVNTKDIFGFPRDLSEIEARRLSPASFERIGSPIGLTPTRIQSALS